MLLEWKKIYLYTFYENIWISMWLIIFLENKIILEGYNKNS
jgi:hypothetical protein